MIVSLFLAFNDSRGSPETINGELVFTDHGNVIGPATERQADEARTHDSRMFSGHLMLFGVIGLLARVPPATVPPRNKRPSSRARGLRGRPGGPRQQPTENAVVRSPEKNGPCFTKRQPPSSCTMRTSNHREIAPACVESRWHHARV